MSLMKLYTFIVLLTAGNAFAGELDTHYLQQFGEVVTDSSKAVMKSARTQTVHKCGMPLRSDLKRDWKRLEESTQKTLAKYLEKPVLTGETVVQSNGGHFRIHYATSGANASPSADTNNNLIPDWVETVGDVFEAVYNREIRELGYKEPPGFPYHVYLMNMPYFGYTESESITGQSATSYIAIENDFAEQVFQNSIPGNDSAKVKSLKALQITAAHEFHHAIQFGYNMYFQAWYGEATATWMEDEVYDSVNQLYDYSSDYLTSTTPTSLDSGDVYSRWIFNRYLYEQFYTTTGIIKDIWEALAIEPAPSYADIPMIPFIDKVLKTHGGTIASSFFGFAKQTYLRNWISHKDEITPANIHPVGTTPVTADTSYNVSSSPLAPYSFAYYRITRSNSNTTPLSIGYNKPPGHTAIAFKSSSPTEYPLDTNNNITVPAFTQGDDVFLLVTNNGYGTSTVTPTPHYGTIPPPPDATNLVSGACGTANGTTVTTPPKSNLCMTGTASAVTGSGPWSWTCAGSNGGTTASCSANRGLVVVNGTCGTSNGTTILSAPAANLCNAGTTSTVSGSGPWSWTCAGSGGGTTASCTASLPNAGIAVP